MKYDLIVLQVSGEGGSGKANITSAVWNYDGTEIVASYNDEEIYLFDATGEGTDAVKKYQGHRNSATGIAGTQIYGF